MVTLGKARSEKEEDEFVLCTKRGQFGGLPLQPVLLGGFDWNKMAPFCVARTHLVTDPVPCN